MKNKFDRQAAVQKVTGDSSLIAIYLGSLIVCCQEQWCSVQLFRQGFDCYAIDNVRQELGLDKLALFAELDLEKS